MPVVRTYTVTQEREVKIRAESPAEAVRLAQESFDAAADGGTLGTAAPEVTSVSARKDF